jgi:glutamyl-tRNA synthetase
MDKKVRTRFAPSPTGYLHVGNIRTGLFAWLVARHFNGVFVLRLEDTDKKREVEGSVDHLLKSLKLLGIDWDEGFDIGGPYNPYKQSERLEKYREWGQKLIDRGRAYADPTTPEELENLREKAKQEKRPFLYRNHRPQNPPLWDGRQPLRFKSEPKEYSWHDEVMGDLYTGPEVIDDIILIKADGYPTYNFAHIIDDSQMQITHVIRGQEYIASVPNYLNLYEALEIKPPLMATMPHILGSDGRKKLSKRDGAKDVLDYIKAGYLSEALLSFIATLGWNDGTEQEIFTREELIKKFSVDRVQRSGAKLDENRLSWINGHFIREMPLDDLYEKSKNFWPEEAKQATENYKQQVLALVKERLKYLAELPGLTRFFFMDLPLNPELISNNKQLSGFTNQELKELLQASLESLEQSDFSLEDLTERLNNLLEQTGQKPAVLFSLIRIATTQAPASPALAGTLHVLGKELSLKRINQQISALEK